MANTTRKRRANAAAAMALLGLIVGGLVYLLARPAHIVMFEWVTFLGLGETLAQARAAFDATVLPDWFVYSSPAALWAFAFAIAMWLIWWDRPTGRLAAFTVALVCGLGHELAQLPGLLPGTFDLADVFAYVVGYALALAVLRRTHEEATHPVDDHHRALWPHGARD